MKKDKLISFRVPAFVHEELVSSANRKGLSLSQFIKDSLAISTASVSVEIQRNIQYHRAALQSLEQIGKRMKVGRSRSIKALQKERTP